MLQVCVLCAVVRFPRSRAGYTKASNTIIKGTPKLSRRTEQIQVAHIQKNWRWVGDGVGVLGVGLEYP